MNDVQQAVSALRDKGWTLAAIATELGTHRETVARWANGSRHPDQVRAVMALLAGLLARKRIPKQRRYGPGSRQRSTDAREDMCVGVTPPVPPGCGPGEAPGRGTPRRP